MAEIKEIPESHLLFQVLNMFTPMSVALRDRLNTYLVKEQYPCYHRLLQPKETASKIYFI